MDCVSLANFRVTGSLAHHLEVVSNARLTQHKQLTQEEKQKTLV